MTNVLDGLAAFSDFWTDDVLPDLIRTKEPWDFAKAPAGAMAKIASLEFAAMFATAANRALKNDKRLFERAPFAQDYAKAELKPHKRTPNSLTNVERDRQRRRINEAISSDMDAMIEFGLFEAVPDQKYVYRITEKGEQIYERLRTTPLASSDHSDSSSHSDGKHPNRQRADGSSDTVGDRP